MKLFKKILIALAVIAVLLVIAVLVKKDYAVQREITINRSEAEVFNYVKYLKNQDNYSKWAMMDPAMKKTYRGTDGTVGFISRWESNSDSVGVGEQEIKKITEGERLDFELRFEKPFEATEQAYMTVTAVNDTQAKVVWGFNGRMNYLMSFMMDMEEMIGNDLQSGLESLKNILESQSPGSAHDGSISSLENYINRTGADLESAIAGLSEAQLNFKPGADKWSIAQCLEHIIASEKMLFDMGRKEMEKPAQPERKAEIKTSDADLIKMVTDRTEKHQAPKELQPSGKYTSTGIAISDFNAGRQPVLAYIRNADLEDLRNHITEYPTGKSDGYQNFLFVAAHTARHTRQIEEIKSHPDFPRQ